MAQLMSPEAVKRGTGKTLQEWLPVFESMSASNLTHKEIATRLADDHGVPGWWCQMLTVLYEQHIGRREPGQDCEGEYSVSASKTLPGSMDDALSWWQERVAGMDAFYEVPVTRGPEESATDKWRYWRAGLADGSRVNVNIYEKAGGKSSLSIQHERLESAEDMEKWRSYWKGLLKSGAVKVVR